MEVSELKQDVRNVFDPLAIRLNLSGLGEASSTTTEFSLGYVAQNLGVQITVDMSDFFIYALLFRPTGDTIPVGYTDASRKPQKLYLQQALKSLSVGTEQETRALRKLAGNHSNCTAMATIIAELIERHWTILLANAEKLLP